MNRHLLWLGALVAIALSACVTPDYEYEDDGPPPEVITTEEPVYYGGFSLYWYGGGWVYRDERGHWAHYNHEVPASVPRATVHVNHAPAPRRYYGQGGYRGTPAPRPTVHVGGGGHPGGGHGGHH